MSDTNRIGFGKKIREKWLIAAIKLRSEDIPFETARGEIETLISATNPGHVAIKKALSNIRQVVFEPAATNAAHSADGIKLFKQMRGRIGLPIAWGLSITSYSFVAATGETIGRLLKLQQEFTAADMARRLTEKLGERGFVQRVARYNLSSFLDWGIVGYNPVAKSYSRASLIRVDSEELLAWLVEAVLIASGQTGMPFNHAISSPLLFPFSFDPVAAAIITNKNPRLHVSRESLSEENIGLIHV
jgi:hypothetical protein